MTMMKRLYICFFLLAMVSTAVIAQDVQQKDDAKKEAKATKPKTEKKAKEPKAKKEKENKSSSKAAAKTTASKTSKTNKKLKKDTPEYEASIKASIQAMDSVLKNSRKISNEITQDHLMKFADLQCEKFGNDPVFMDKMAEAFYLNFSDVFGAERYAALRKMHPTYIDGFISEAKLFNDLGWKDAPAYEPSKLETAKALMDSAKIAFPTSTEPYMRWIYWQCPYRYITKTGYENLSVDAELEAVTKKFPDYPASLEVARFYDNELSKKKGIDEDLAKTYIVYAADFYERTKRELMTPIDIVSFADICRQSNDTLRFAKGLDYLNYGISKQPDYPYFYRFKMWLEGEYAFRTRKEKERSLKFQESVIETGTQFMERFDTIVKLPQDYEYLINAYMQNESYLDAIKFINDQIGTNLLDSINYASALGKIIDCHNGLGETEKAINAFRTFENYKKEKNIAMTIRDFQKITTPYQKIAKDTLQDKEKRIMYYYSLDSIYQKMGVLSPEDIGYTEVNRLNLTRERNILEGNNDANPIILEASNRLIDAINGIFANKNEFERDEIDVYYLMTGYYWKLAYYWSQEGKSGFDGAFETSEKMLNDMPYSVEFKNLNNTYKRFYDGYQNIADNINKKLRDNGYGKRKK